MPIPLHFLQKFHRRLGEKPMNEEFSATSPSPVTPKITSPLGGEGVKKSIWFFFTSFRRKPESRVFRALRTEWTPVFTGVTAEIQFFHSFREGKGGGDLGNYFTASGRSGSGWKGNSWRSYIFGYSASTHFSFQTGLYVVGVGQVKFDSFPHG